MLRLGKHNGGQSPDDLSFNEEDGRQGDAAPRNPEDERFSPETDDRGETAGRTSPSVQPQPLAGTAKPAEEPASEIMASANAAEGDVEDDGIADADDDPDSADSGGADDPTPMNGRRAKGSGIGSGAAVDGGCPYLMVKADDDALIPKAMNFGDAGFDLAAAEDALIPGNNGRAVIGTGIALAIARGYAGFVLSRSGLAAKNGLAVLNAPGLIDSGYRDELKVILINTGHDAQKIRKGDRIAQLVIQKVEDPILWRTESLPLSERGKNGLGSTGV